MNQRKNAPLKGWDELDKRLLEALELGWGQLFFLLFWTGNY